MDKLAKTKMVIMIKAKGKIILYRVDSELLGQVSPYLFVERLAEEIMKVFPFLVVKKLFSSKKQSSLEIHSLCPSNYSDQQVNLIKIQIELIASNLVLELKDKIYFAGLVS